MARIFPVTAYFKEQPLRYKSNPQGIAVWTPMEVENLRGDCVMNPAEIVWIDEEKPKPLRRGRITRNGDR